MKKVLTLLLGLGLLFSSAISQEKKMQVYLFGGLSHVYEYGSVDDYVFVENDFPVMPAHSSHSLGAAFTYFFTENIGIEPDVRYSFSSNVILQDPSDLDTLQVDSAQHYSLSLNVIYRFLFNNFCPYLLAGGGINNVSQKEGRYTSQYGYEIIIEAPDDDAAMDFLINFGGGAQYNLGKSLGFRLDMRYIFIFDQPDKVKAFNGVIGVVFRF